MFVAITNMIDVAIVDSIATIETWQSRLLFILRVLQYFLHHSPPLHIPHHHPMHGSEYDDLGSEQYGCEDGEESLFIG